MEVECVCGGGKVGGERCHVPVVEALLFGLDYPLMSVNRRVKLMDGSNIAGSARGCDGSHRFQNPPFPHTHSHSSIHKHTQDTYVCPKSVV